MRKPAPADLEPIETASRDELAALQLERLRWTLGHAYDNVPRTIGKNSTPRASSRPT